MTDPPVPGNAVRVEMTAGPPGPGILVPACVTGLTRGRAVRPVWENELGGVTFAVGTGRQGCYVKWAPAGSAIDLAAEAVRLRWAAQYTPVPRLLDQGADAAGWWLVTSVLPGTMAVAGRWKAEPLTAVTAIGAGLRAMHDRLPVAGCPFSWSARERLAEVRQGHRLLDPAQWHPCHQHLSPRQALELLADIPSAAITACCTTWRPDHGSRTAVALGREAERRLACCGGARCGADRPVPRGDVARFPRPRRSTC